NDAFLEKLLEASRMAGEKMWRMPLDEEYKEQLKSDFADLHNIGGRPGGAVTAAKFLHQFVKEAAPGLLRIPAAAWVDKAKPYIARGASGIAMRTFTNLALNFDRL